MSQRDDLDKLNQLGNKNTKYSYDYDPSLLEKMKRTSIRTTIISSNSTVLNLRASARRQASRISLRFTFPIFLINTWWKANH